MLAAFSVAQANLALRLFVKNLHATLGTVVNLNYPKIKTDEREAPLLYNIN